MRAYAFILIGTKIIRDDLTNAAPLVRITEHRAVIVT